MLANSNVTERQKAKYGKQKNEDNRRAVEAYLRTKDLEDTAIFGIMGVIDKETGGSFDYRQMRSSFWRTATLAHSILRENPRFPLEAWT